MIRAFIGIALPDAHVAALGRLQARLPVGRASPPENLHLTLAFLGEQREPVLEEVHVALGSIRLPAADLTVAGVGTFGKRAPRVVFADVVAAPGLGRLRDKVRAAVRGAGIDLPRDRFRPHVTLARLSPGLPAEALERLRVWLEEEGGFRLPPVAVEEVTLFRSTLTRSGALHDPLATYPVG